MKPKTLSPLDQAIVALANEFAKIPDYETKMQDDELRRMHIFVAAGILSIRDAMSLVLTSFIPAANRAVANIKSQIQRSNFKDEFSRIHFDPNSTQHETIRLGYVFVFHKFEVFVNDLMALMDELADDVDIPLKKYAKAKFDFSPTDWYLNSSIHLINFISNCTKHQDGRCKLGNSAYKMPAEFLQHPTDDRIVRTTQQFKFDVNALIEAITPLITIISSIYVYRAMEPISKISDSEGESDIYRATLALMTKRYESSIRNNIVAFCR